MRGQRNVKTSAPQTPPRARFSPYKSHSMRFDLIRFEQVESLKRNRLTGIAAGDRHSLFLSGDGSVWSTGKADNGALGLGNVRVSHSPKAIKRWDEKRAHRQ